jgi:hypothetical protein
MYENERIAISGVEYGEGSEFVLSLPIEPAGK